MYYCSYKSGFLSILNSMEKQTRVKNKPKQFDEVSEESKVTAETDFNVVSSDGGTQSPYIFYIFQFSA